MRDFFISLCNIDLGMDTLKKKEWFYLNCQSSFNSRGHKSVINIIKGKKQAISCPKSLPYFFFHVKTLREHAFISWKTRMIFKDLVYWTIIESCQFLLLFAIWLYRGQGCLVYNHTMLNLIPSNRLLFMGIVKKGTKHVSKTRSAWLLHKNFSLQTEGRH